MNTQAQYHHLANLFRYPKESYMEQGKLKESHPDQDYPRDGYKERVAATADLLLRDYPEAGRELQRFTDYMATHDLYEIEEVFTKTFHIQALCYLDLGYVLFGEDYKRGEFLVHMKQEQKDIGNDCGEELPDNLPNVLELMSMHKEPEFLNELAIRVLRPALVKMESEFEEARMQLRRKVLLRKHRALILDNLEHGNIYRHAITALIKVVDQDFAGVEYEATEVEPGLNQAFLKNCGPNGCGPSLGAPQSAMGMGSRKNEKH